MSIWGPCPWRKFIMFTFVLCVKIKKKFLNLPEIDKPGWRADSQNWPSCGIFPALVCDFLIYYLLFLRTWERKEISRARGWKIIYFWRVFFSSTVLAFLSSLQITKASHELLKKHFWSERESLFHYFYSCRVILCSRVTRYESMECKNKIIWDNLSRNRFSENHFMARSLLIQ